MSKTTIINEEIEKFATSPSDTGILSKMIPIKMQYIQQQARKANIEINNASILDIGCNIGLLCEAFARLESKTIMGIDASSQLINIAKERASLEALNINYQATTIEGLAEGTEGEDFGNQSETKHDIILAMDIVEHVNDVEYFINSCINKLNQNGIIIICTINKTIYSKIFVKFFAEYLLKIVPIDTHNYDKFLSPQELISFVKNIKSNDSIAVQDITGIRFNPILNKFSLQENYKMNYFITFKRS